MALVQYRSDDELLGVLTDLSGADVLGDDVLGDDDDVDTAADEYFTPDVEQEIDDMAEEAILLGYADDPELMGSVLSKFVRKVAKKIKRKIKGKKRKVKALRIPTAATPAPEEGPAGLLKNPLVLVALAGGALLLLSKKRRKAAA
jgi:hypothetical protein